MNLKRFHKVLEEAETRLTVDKRGLAVVQTALDRPGANSPLGSMQWLATTSAELLTGRAIARTDDEGRIKCTSVTHTVCDIEKACSASGIALPKCAPGEFDRLITYTEALAAMVCSHEPPKSTPAPPDPQKKSSASPLMKWEDEQAKIAAAAIVANAAASAPAPAAVEPPNDWPAADADLKTLAEFQAHLAGTGRSFEAGVFYQRHFTNPNE